MAAESVYGAFFPLLVGMVALRVLKEAAKLVLVLLFACRGSLKGRFAKLVSGSPF